MRSILKRSAFCDGGSCGGEMRTILVQKRANASRNRIGMIVNVYRNESKHKTKPKPMV